MQDETMVPIYDRANITVRELALLKKELDEARGAMSFHKRAAKLMRKRKNFLVVAEDEPYFMSVYETIREKETKDGKWTAEDEAIFQKIGRMVNGN